MSDGFEDARNVLCVRLDNVGDVLMTTPALRALKALSGTPRLTLLASPAGAALAPLVPEIDEVIPYAAPWMKPPAPEPAEAFRTLVERLAARAFDAAVIFTVYSQSPLPAALACLLAGIPRRLAHCRENPYALLTHWLRETEPERGVSHEVHRQLGLVGLVGAHTDDERLALRIPAIAHAHAGHLLREARVEGPWVAIHAGASAPSRRYAPERFAAVADGLVAAGLSVVFIGGGEEQELVARIRGRMTARATSLVGRTDLGGLAALLARAGVLVANNSGPAHVAAAVGTPVVSLYALTNPQHTPWGVPHRVLNHPAPCAYCYQSLCRVRNHPCLDVPPEAVCAAALELLRARVEPDPPPPDPIAAEAALSSS